MLANITTNVTSEYGKNAVSGVEIIGSQFITATKHTGRIWRGAGFAAFRMRL